MAMTGSACETRRWRPSARRSSGERGLPCESTAIGKGPAPRGVNTVTSIAAAPTATRMTPSLHFGAPWAERMTAAKAAATRRFISVPVVLGLVGAFLCDADVLRLVVGELGEHRAE